VKDEADFYDLPGLVEECTFLLSRSEVEQQMKVYARVVSQIEKVKRWTRNGGEVVFQRKAKPDSLLSLLRSKVFASAWVIWKVE